MIFALLLAIVLPMLLAAAFLLGRHRARRQDCADQLSPVTRQHIEIFQKGELNEEAIASAIRRFRYLFERGEDGAVEASLRPGVQFVFQVRALAEIGTDAAGRILERQLHRHLTDDQLEQAWYWIDLAGSLRALNRLESLPQLLRCAEAASKMPLGHFFAAETVCFLGFAGYLRQGETALGRAALRVLQAALEGLRHGLPPQVVAEARLGELLENLWDNRPNGFQPLVVRVFHEVLRFLRRVPHARAALLDDRNDAEAFEWQYSRLAALEPILVEFLAEARSRLPGQLRNARAQALADLLHALIDLRIDAGAEVLEVIKRGDCDFLELAVASLTWSKSPCVGEWLLAHAADRVSMKGRSPWRPRLTCPGPMSLPRSFAYETILHALRGHPSASTEKCLLLAAQDRDPVFRRAAFGSLGWWEPILTEPTRKTLEVGRRDPSPEVRQAARAALARLGERAALHWFRQGLHADDPAQMQEAVQVVAREGLVFLWPDLDRLADSETMEISQLAREALERMAEEMHAG